ncbi:hypothetical protein [Natrinema sp. SYSU A 869]|uniref:DUF7344 domain-containing protein n=1 Tax=Natrinema sp. SYSU A 869 TaxID=2871694 RepID=UPI001CA3AA3F|nr:hypothetical protein [Natrinema sp. SYSU A 869]
MTVRDVSNEVVAREYAAPLPDVPSADVKRVYLSLLHVHLPLLADANVINYDPDRGVIEDINLEAVEPLLSTVTADESSTEPAR